MDDKYISNVIINFENSIKSLYDYIGTLKFTVDFEKDKFTDAEAHRIFNFFAQVYTKNKTVFRRRIKKEYGFTGRNAHDVAVKLCKYLTSHTENMEFTVDALDKFKFRFIDQSPLKYKRLDKENKAFKRSMTKNEMLLSNCVIMLTNTFESLVQTVFEGILSQENTDLNKKMISFKELSSLENIKDVKEYLILKEVDSIKRGNVISWIDTLDKKGINKQINKEDKLKEQYEKLNELFMRRNIIVHNGGVVNNKYLSSIKTSNLKRGDQISTTVKYLRGNLEVVREVGTYIFVDFWKKYNKGVTKSFVNTMSTIAYDLLNKNPKLSFYIYTIIIRHRDKSDPKNNKIEFPDYFNYLLSAKLSSESDNLCVSTMKKLRKITSDYKSSEIIKDSGLSSEGYDLIAFYLLEDNYDNVKKLLTSIKEKVTSDAWEYILFMLSGWTIVKDSPQVLELLKQIDGEFKKYIF